MVSSRFKQAHRTHALAQRAGASYPLPVSQADRDHEANGQLLALFAELCVLVPDGPERAKLLGVGNELEAAWERGAGMPLLRAHRKAVERALRMAAETSAHSDQPKQS